MICVKFDVVGPNNLDHADIDHLPNFVLTVSHGVCLIVIVKRVLHQIGVNYAAQDEERKRKNNVAFDLSDEDISEFEWREHLVLFSITVDYEDGI